MKIRGQRECKACGTQWSYYETGDVSCPACESLQSVGVDTERALHTATATTLELTSLREVIDSEPIDRIAGRAVALTRAFTRGYGFIDAGRLTPLDDTYLAAMELKYVAGELSRRMELTEDEERYFTELLRADEGARPERAAVPQSMRAARGLAYATAVREYRSDIRTYLEEHPDPATDRPLARLSTHLKRVRALDGDVTPLTAETLIRAARALGSYVSEGDEKALTLANERLDSLS